MEIGLLKAPTAPPWRDKDNDTRNADRQQKSSIADERFDELKGSFRVRVQFGALEGGQMSESLNAQEIMRITGPDATRLLGPGEVARWLGVSAGWVRDHATRKQPRIKAVKIGKLLRFRAEDVEDFIRERSQ